ncbi:MAG: Gfo/Idh/MocA family protein [Gemmatimonadota bacterium]
MSSNRRDFFVQSAGALAGFALLPELSLATPRPAGAARKLAVIGVGRQGRDIIDELRKIEAVEIAAICDVLPMRLNSGRERAPGAEAFADFRELLSKRADVEAVVVATPTHLHHEIVLAALAAGRHVYCEAPLAASLEDARAIAEAASQATTVFQSGLYARANPIYKRALLLARSDSVRDIASIYGQYHRKTSWRFAGPAALNWRLDPAVSLGLPGEQGAHQFDVAVWMRNKDPVRVSGIGAVRHYSDGRAIPDTVSVQLVWEDGVVMNYQATLANSYGGAYEVINGSNGSVRLAGTHGWMFKEADAATQGWEVYATRQHFHNDEGIVLVADATKLAAQGRLKEGAGLEHPPLYYSLAAFVESFANGAPVVCTAADGLRATAIGIAAHQAVMSGNPVDLSTFS